MQDNQNEQWDLSFDNKQNYLFYPHEEVIRFVSKYVTKRIGFNEFSHVQKQRKMLDLGCGIGRHVVYGCENEIDSYGIDLSASAISYAKKFAESRAIDNVEARLVVGDVRELPWEDGEFNIVVSHGVLDSMSFDIAKKAVQEVHRVTSDGAMFYCDLVCHPSGKYEKEDVVETDHEKGTIQSYFTEKKIDDLFSDHFSIVEKVSVSRENYGLKSVTVRWHLVLKKI